jgi:acyl-CoA oxidase
MPGIKTGDMGPKLGYFSKDNGWMTMNKVRVPRSQLLQRYFAVDREGSFSIEGDMRALYTTMMYIRYLLLYSSKFFLAATLLIAIRYSVVRR